VFEFLSQDNLTRLTVEPQTDSNGDSALNIRRWFRGEMNQEWEEDEGNAMTLWPSDPVRNMIEFLVAAWSAQTKATGQAWR